MHAMAGGETLANLDAEIQGYMDGHAPHVA